MSRAYGWNAQLLIAEENEYGVPPEENYRKIPFISSSLDSEQNLVSSNVLGLGRDPTQPFQDVINVDGDMAVPVDMRNIGLWLKAVFGAPATTDNEDGSFTHTFESGKTSVPSYSLEVGLPEIPQFIRFSGVRANSIAFNFQRSGEAQATINLMAQGESGSETAIDTIDLGVASLSGSISARYGDNELLDKARAGTPVDVELGYQLSDNLKLVITCHEVYLPKPKRSIDGPGGIECSYDFQGAKDQTLGKMMTVTLVNDVEKY